MPPRSLTTCIALACLASPSAPAQLLSWNGLFGSNLSDPLNWLPFGQPGTSSTIVFEGTSFWSASIDAPLTVLGIDVRQGGILDLGGVQLSAQILDVSSEFQLLDGIAHFSAVTHTNGSLQIGDYYTSGESPVRVLVTGPYRLGGAVDLDAYGAHAYIYSGSELVIQGANEPVALDVGTQNGGASMRVEGGHLEVKGLTRVGSNGYASVELLVGSRMVADDIILGHAEGDLGSLTLHGNYYYEADEEGREAMAAAKLEVLPTLVARDVVVASLGYGSIDVNHGTSAALNSLIVAHGGGSYGHMMVNGGSVNVAQGMEIGRGGHAYVNVYDGSLNVGIPQQGPSLSIGISPGSFGILNVGHGGNVAAGESRIGLGGSGGLTISGGGRMTSSGAAAISGEDSYAYVYGVESKWTVSGNLEALQGASIVASNGGHIFVSGDVGINADASLELFDMGVLTVQGTLVNAGEVLMGNGGTIAGNVINHGQFALANGGYYYSGDSEGSGYGLGSSPSVILGSFTQTATGVLAVSAGGYGQPGLLVVEGNADLAGTLQLELYYGWESLRDLTAMVQVSGLREGTFGLINVLGLPDELSLITKWDGNTLLVQVVPEPSTYVLMVVGMAACLFWVRRRGMSAARSRD